MKRRAVLFCGDIRTPESAKVYRLAPPTPGRQQADESSDGRQPGRSLSALLAALPQQPADGPASMMGVALLRHAATGASLATLDADAAFHHAASLDPFFQFEGHSGKQVTAVKSASGSFHSLLLLSVGQVLLLSEDSLVHATAVTCAEGRGGSLTGVQDVAAGKTHFVMCTDTGAVYTFGWSNAYGQLGDGSRWAVDGYDSEDRKQLPSHGRFCSAPVLTDPKRIPGFGLPSDGSIADCADAYDGGRPAQAPVLIISVACGDHHTVLLSATRTAVYTCGRGHYGQLGTFRKVELSTSFRCIKPLFGGGIVVSGIAAAGNHTTLLLDSGKVVSCGECATGAVGTGSLVAAIEATEVAWVSTIANVAPNSITYNASGSPRRAVDDKAMLSIKAPYGTAESYLYPRRVFRMDPKPSDPTAPRIAEVHTSAWLTILKGRDQSLYSAGLLQRANPVTERVDASGHLCRRVTKKDDATRFGECSLTRCSTAANGGWQIAVGCGFVAFLDEARGLLRFQGRITIPNNINSNHVTISSFDIRHADSYRTPEDDSIVLRVGSKRRVVAALGVGSGLMLLVEDL